MERAYRNSGYFFLALIPIFVAGFWVPYFSEVPKFDPSITTVVHLHAALLFSFLGLLVFQPLAIRHGAFTTHRTLGKISYLLMPAVALSAIAVIWKEYSDNLAQGTNFIKARNAEFLSITQLLLLVSLYCLAIFSIRRRDVGSHLRFIICIAFVLLPAGLARTFGYWFGIRQNLSQTICLAVIDLGLICLIAFDHLRQRSSFPYILALSAYTVIEVTWFALGRPI